MTMNSKVKQQAVQVRFKLTEPAWWLRRGVLVCRCYLFSFREEMHWNSRMDVVVLCLSLVDSYLKTHISLLRQTVPEASSKLVRSDALRHACLPRFVPSLRLEYLQLSFLPASLVVPLRLSMLVVPLSLFFCPWVPCSPLLLPRVAFWLFSPSLVLTSRLGVHSAV